MKHIEVMSQNFIKIKRTTHIYSVAQSLDIIETVVSNLPFCW